MSESIESTSTPDAAEMQRPEPDALEQTATKAAMEAKAATPDSNPKAVLSHEGLHINYHACSRLTFPIACHRSEGLPASIQNHGYRGQDRGYQKTA